MAISANTAFVPLQEEDIAQRTWDHEDPSFSERRRSKGKEKEQPFPSTFVADPSDSTGFAVNPTRGSYPPTNDENAEAQRVQETLKAFEAKELQRRKTARQSSASATTAPSLVDTVSRRATLLLSGRGSRKSGSVSSTNLSAGGHARLPTQDQDAAEVPLTAIPASPTPSPSRSEIDIRSPPLDDPFNPPGLLPRSPFADPTAGHSASSSSILDPQTSALAPQTPTQSDPFIARQPPPALPLGLPPPRSPPPKIPRTPSPPGGIAVVEDKRTRWWHEWLCGCGEGPNRGGDVQSGKTNPYE